ncbi:MAG: hypothetical protein GY834_05865 [Bacteroidetes bacterium]|nr:hypothetical protein [Bacteroidota bacterium]
MEDGISLINRMDLSYVDSNRIDLLKQDNHNAFNQSLIKLYYMQNDEKEYLNISFSNNEALCFLRFYTNVGTLFLEFNDQKMTDTINSELISDGTNLIRKIWYNSELTWNNGGNENLYLTIVK